MPVATFESAETLAPLVGQELVVSDWLTISQDRINQFADATDDHQWIHIDPERAKRESPFGDAVAHGFLTLSLLSRFLTESMHITSPGWGVNYGANRVRFTAPVLVGSRIRGRFVLKELAPLTDGAQMVWSATVDIEGQDRPACVAEFVTRRHVLPASQSK